MERDKSGFRVLLLDAETRLYFKDFEKWTDNPAEALCFQSSYEAMMAALRNRVLHGEVVLSCEGGQQNLRTPIDTTYLSLLHPNASCHKQVGIFSQPIAPIAELG